MLNKSWFKDNIKSINYYYYRIWFLSMSSWCTVFTKFIPFLSLILFLPNNFLWNVNPDLVLKCIYPLITASWCIKHNLNLLIYLWFKTSGRNCCIPFCVALKMISVVICTLCEHFGVVYLSHYNMNICFSDLLHISK